MVWWVVLVAMGLGIVAKRASTVRRGAAALRVRSRAPSCLRSTQALQEASYGVANKKIIIGAVALVVIASPPELRQVVAALDGANRDCRGDPHARSRAVVSASGKIQPKRFVNISADTSGRVVDLAVNEGDRVAGPVPHADRPRRCGPASRAVGPRCSGAEAGLEQARQAVETARVQLAVAQQNLKRQQELWKQQLTPREVLERAENDVKIAQSSLRRAREADRTQGTPDRAGPRACERAVRSQQGPH